MAGGTLCALLRVQKGIAFCATLGAILWFIFHGYPVVVCFLVALACIFQIVLFLYLAAFVDALAKAQAEMLRSALSSMCLSAGVPDPEIPQDEEDDQDA